MKTAISIPDETFERVERQTAKLGISRSEFFARAAHKYLRELEGPELTEAINRALADDPQNDAELELLQKSAASLSSSDPW